jgi:hypothetical protein
VVPLAVVFANVGCSRFQHVTHEYVYVAARQVYLHDRVAAVSNRVALVTNGEALEVVERGKRFIKVRTPKGEVGWLEDHAFIDDKLFAQFQDLSKHHAQDPVVATGELRDDLYLHVLPGRDTPHFLLEAGNSKVQLLERGTVERTNPGAPLASRQKNTIPSQPAATDPKSRSNPGLAAKAVKPVQVAPLVSPAVPVQVEDWWLVRDSYGNTGWLLASRLDVAVPDEVGQYAEGQRMVGAYPIAKVIDDGSGHESRHDSMSGKHGGKDKPVKTELRVPDDTSATPVSREITEYVTILSPPRNGLQYDFDQVRVFTWSLNHHRYETAYRLHGVQGYLPLRFSQETVNGVTEPVFSFAIASGPDVRVDPDTGVTRPVQTRTLAFRLEGNLIKRTGSDMAPIILTHDSVELEKAKAARKKKK